MGQKVSTCIFNHLYKWSVTFKKREEKKNQYKHAQRIFLKLQIN